MTTPDIEATVRTWLVAEAPPVAPPTLLDGVRTRRSEVAQRRWLAYLPIPRMPAVPTFLPSATSVAAVVVVALTVSLGVFVAGGRSPEAGVVPSVRPGVTIEFEITVDGVMSAFPGRIERGSGTFTMTGMLRDEGTFTEVVSVTPQGDYEIERTLVGSHGRMVVVAAARTWIEGSFDTKVLGTWYLADGGAAYPGVVAEGTLTGIHGSRPRETWVGEVRR
jgi:hypothetical protein